MPREIASWYYKLLHLWRVDEIFEINFEFKRKQPTTKIYFEFFFQKFVDKILENCLVCIISELLMYIFLLGSNDRFSGLFSKRTSRAAILAQALVIEVLEFFLDWIYIFERHNLNFQIFILKMITFYFLWLD